MPDGGLHDPSGSRASTTPDPPVPPMCGPPVRNVVKIARPRARAIASGGIFTSVFRFDFVLLGSLGDGDGGGCARGLGPGFTALPGEGCGYAESSV